MGLQKVSLSCSLLLSVFNISQNIAPEAISDDLGLPLERIITICDLLTKYPQKSDNEIAEYFIKDTTLDDVQTE